MGGGNAIAYHQVEAIVGLSPRGRGKHRPVHLQRIERRSIPAWAGETSSPVTGASTIKVYPRVGGGNPRTRPPTRASSGLSPRGRGKQRIVESDRYRSGSIPAWAGETRLPISPLTARKVYPRVGGGNISERSSAHISAGLSPRGRGKHAEYWGIVQQIRSIPAWAGETCRTAMRAHAAGVYPRVGGGNATRPTTAARASGLSPRGRGKRSVQPRVHAAARSIPAWAGETSDMHISQTNRPVYPRVGGGN